MKIIFLNAWKGKLLDPMRDFLIPQKPDTDVFCFQEATDEMLSLCADILKEFHLINDFKITKDDAVFRQATYIKNPISMVSHAIVLENIPNVGLGLHTKLKVNGRSVNVCNVHGVSTPGDKEDTAARIEQSQGILSFYENIEGLKVIGGDFNLKLETESVSVFEKQGYRNLIKDFGIKNTRNRLVWDEYPKSKQYYADYVFVSSTVDVTDFLVPNVEVSDHQPLIIKFDI